ncbi:uracil-xanthine permease family protein [Egicoccus halophilus]|uniref:Uracil permease n=1 Tax=Egicoccus halophilus TaxID=1670830 RepID=A0A8J3AHS9_9ACTN|nr:nucleobase:cation symporter-2 family protein [Egicoccus halophilus]GGI08979.1 uracil permease [Egicoccus halophilus]
MSTVDRSDVDVLYDVEDMPPLREAIPLGLQHVLVMVASNVTIPIILAGVVGAATGETAFLVQVALLVAGLTTLLQTIGIGPVGARLPVVQGTSFGFLVISIPLASEFGLSAIFGGAIVAGVVQVALGLSLRWLKSLFPPLVSGIVVLVIGIGLLPTGVNLAGGGAGAEDFGSPSNLLLAGLVLLTILVTYAMGRGVLSAAAVLVGLVVGYLAAIPFGKVDGSQIAEAAWFSFPMPLEFGLSFPAAAVIGMSVMAIATSVETIGDLAAVTKGGAGRDVTDRELSGGVMADGVGTAFASLFSALPNTSFSQNVGLVAFTGVMSRHVVSIGAVFLVLAGLFPKIAAVIAVMPPAVLGGAAIVMFAMVGAAGVRLLAESRLDRRDLLIIAVAVGVGQGMAAVPDLVALAPEQLRVLLVTGIVPAGFLAVLLNVVLPGRPDTEDTTLGVAAAPDASLGDTEATAGERDRNGTRTGRDAPPVP